MAALNRAINAGSASCRAHVDSFRSFEEALVTEDQEYDVIALPEQRRWQPVPRD